MANTISPSIVSVRRQTLYSPCSSSVHVLEGGSQAASELKMCRNRKVITGLSQVHLPPCCSSSAFLDRFFQTQSMICNLVSGSNLKTLQCFTIASNQSPKEMDCLQYSSLDNSTKAQKSDQDPSQQ